MKLPAIVALLGLAACAAPAPTASPAPVDCADVPAPNCEAAAEAGETLTGTDALAVESLPLPTDGGMEMSERYLVRLTGEGGGDEQLAEVVRFAGSTNWSVRRLESVPTE